MSGPKDAFLYKSLGCRREISTKAEAFQGWPQSQCYSTCVLMLKSKVGYICIALLPQMIECESTRGRDPSAFSVSESAAEVICQKVMR
jgi:hypothetical protein